MRFHTLLTLLSVLVLTTIAFAQDQTPQATGGCQNAGKADCPMAGKTTQTAAKADCPMAGMKCDPANCDMTKCGPDTCPLAMAKKAGLAVPTVLFQVGDQKVDCPDKAAELAKANGGTVKYIVADKVYDQPAEAMAAVAAALDKSLPEFTSVRYVVGKDCMSCPMQAQSVANQTKEKVQYRVALATFTDKTAAERAAVRAREAADKVTPASLTKAGGTCCQAGAGATAKAGQCPAGKTEAATDGKVMQTAAKTDAKAGGCCADKDQAKNLEQEMAKMKLIQARMLAAVQAASSETTAQAAAEQPGT
jgi:hypothetical protein